MKPYPPLPHHDIVVSPSEMEFIMDTWAKWSENPGYAAHLIVERLPKFKLFNSYNLIVDWTLDAKKL